MERMVSVSSTNPAHTFWSQCRLSQGNVSSEAVFIPVVLKSSGTGVERRGSFSTNVLNTSRTHILISVQTEWRKHFFRSTLYTSSLEVWRKLKSQKGEVHSSMNPISIHILISVQIKSTEVFFQKRSLSSLAGAHTNTIFVATNIFFVTTNITSVCREKKKNETKKKNFLSFHKHMLCRNKHNTYSSRQIS